MYIILVFFTALKIMYKIGQRREILKERKRRRKKKYNRYDKLYIIGKKGKEKYV